MRHVILPWDQCPLSLTVQWLTDEYRTGSWLDLSKLLLVSNSSHAQSRLQEKLVEHCDQNQWILTPPKFLTVGQLPEELYQPQRPFASSIAQRLMWVRALQKMSAEQLQAVIPNPPEPGEIARWLTIVQSLSELHRDLASEMKRFFSGRDAAASLKDPQEDARWKFLVDAQSLYWEELNRAELWDRQTARMIAVDHQECRCDKTIVMVGTVDLNQVVRAMLLQVESQVSILTFAGLDHVSLFDSLGCLKIDAWCDKHIDVPEERIGIAERPEDQASMVIEYLNSLDGRFRADEITIGVPDDSVVPYLESELQAAGVPCRYARGPSLLGSSFFRMIEAIGDFGATRDYLDFAAVIRHPAITRYLGQRVSEPDWLAKVDQWFERHLPSQIRDPDSLPGIHSSRNQVVRQVVNELLQVLEPVLLVAEAPLNRWPDLWNQVLQRLLAGYQVHNQDPHDRGWIKSLAQYSEVLTQFQELKDQWVFEVHSADFLRMVFSELRGKYTTPFAQPDAIAMLGWLDAPLDDAPVTVVTSFNEGLIPSSDPAHPFLTQSLRQQLQLLDNRRRYARDAYALELLTHSRTDYRLILGRYNAAGEPRNPSRLLMAMSVDELPYRAKYLFGETVEESAGAEMQLETELLNSGLKVPEPLPLLEPVEQVRVTDFKAYLACPFRFYLQRVLKLRSVDDRIEELSGGQFGDLLHNVLEAFGTSELKDSRDAEEIKLYLESLLEREATSTFGKDQRASLRLQLTQAKLRLERFAVAQVAHREAGWRIEHLERDASFWMTVDDEAVEIVGRIDRIDINEKDGRWLVLDYKTSDSFQNLERLYFRKKEWIDLQLPLYQHLVRSIPEARDQSVSLGLIALPKKLDDIKFITASWDDRVLRSAWDLAAEVIRKIRAQQFSPKSEDRFFDPGIERICQTGVLNLE